ncbi:hypothetical protein BVC71_00340 [Marivivens niveibacter]|uniref:DUF4130 domain-containing protein n=1 Tax=Marivivens niveibacter TaxID=1930667 RepID=A0A251WZY8_9RHOB|nr:DUF4130 domain-containing protein [Marivivens niveibacter]OUD10007.1 hypothetical protein BVC71_00340 [Marivivens niveibacter]
MVDITLPFAGTVSAWRQTARRLLAARIPPEHLHWKIGAALDIPRLPAEKFKVRVPERFVHLSDVVGWHDAADRFALLYRTAWGLRLKPTLLTETNDPDVATLITMEQDVLTSLRRFNQRLRLHELPSTTSRRMFAGWCDIQQDPLEIALPRLRRQLSEFDWVIYTPARAVRSTAQQEFIFRPPERPDLPRNTAHPDWVRWLQAQEYPAYDLIGPALPPDFQDDCDLVES